jgi:hypothetical protein
MRVTFPTSELFDRAGMIVSLACGIHCVCLPILVSVASFGWLARFAGASSEWWFIGGSVAFGLLGHASGYLRRHGRLRPGLLFLIGLLCVLSGRLWFESSAIEPWVMALGGATLAVAHWVNLRLCAACSRCATQHPQAQASSVATPVG